MRRTHTKSRRGCAECKKRHVKCNENHPSCANCSRLGVSCSFSTPVASSSSAQSPASTPSAAVTNDGKTNEDSVEPLPVLDLELLHNLITQTHTTFIQTEERRKVLDIYVQLGFSNHYLLHAMLALSALHLHSQDKSRIELLSRASAHQNAALRLVQPLIANICEDTSVGIFAFSGYTAIYAIAKVALQIHEGVQQDLVGEMLSCFQLSRGIKAVIGPYFRYLLTTPVAPSLIYEDHGELIRPTMERDYGPPMQVLRLLIDKVEDEDERNACRTAADKCFEYIAVLAVYPQDHESSRLIQTWPVEVGKEYLSMLAARQPTALVLLAHFGVLMYMRKNAWYLSGLPQTLLLNIESVLGDDWSEALAWPKAVIINNEMPMAHVANIPDKDTIMEHSGPPGLTLLANAAQQH